MTDTPRLAALRRVFLAAYGWSARRLYDELAPIYDPVSALVSGGRWDAWRRFALEYVTGRSVLEIGFGTGELLLALAEEGFDVVGVEPSEAMHRVARRKLRRRGLVIPRLRAPAAALPFAAACFDTVVSTFPADYILQPDSLREIARVLVPGGRLVISGLTIELPPSPSRPLSWLPSASGRLWDYLAGIARDAGLAPEVYWHDDPPARVPVFVASRPGGRPLDPAAARRAAP